MIQWGKFILTHSEKKITNTQQKKPFCRCLLISENNIIKYLNNKLISK